MTSRTYTPTAAQIEALLDFLEEHRDLARGILRDVEGRAHSRQLWENICTTLNSIGGCIKTTKQWQKVWTDKKYLTKKTAAAARRSASATGGGPSIAPQLSNWELRIISIMGDGFGEPQTTARVAAFPEQTQEPSVPAVDTPVSPQFENISDFPPVFDQHLHLSTDTGEPSQVPAPIGDTQNRTSRTRQSRERRRQPSRLIDDQRSIRERLFYLEQARMLLDQQRNEELSEIKLEVGGIRQTMAELSGMVQQFIEKITKN